MERRIIRTGDGSKTLYIDAMNESYHSKHGALQEAKHVFISSGLHHWIKQHPDSKEIHLFEMGLGTGMNALLTMEALSTASLKGYYTGIEAFPLSTDLVLELYEESWGSRLRFTQIHSGPWNTPFALDDRLEMLKIHQRFEDFQSLDTYDLLYFDAFGARAQPELWETQWIAKCAKMLNPGGVFVTYSSKGSVRRALASEGLEVEKLAGPPGKREMLRAVKPQS